MRLELLRARAPEVAPEVAALRRNETVVEEVAVLNERAFVGLHPLLVLHPAVRPCRAREVHYHRKPRMPQAFRHAPVDAAPRLVVAPRAAVFREPRRRDLSAGSVEPEPLEIRSVRRTLVYPGVLIAVAGAFCKGVGSKTAVVEVADEKARLPVNEEVPVCADFERRALRHHERRLGLAELRRRRGRLPHQLKRRTCNNRSAEHPNPPHVISLYSADGRQTHGQRSRASISSRSRKFHAGRRDERSQATRQ